MAQLKDLIVTGDARIVGNDYNNNPKVAYGTCATAAATAAKEIVISDPTWNLQVGDIIGIKFTNTNSVSNVTFNVNGTGAIGVSYNTSRPYTGSSSQILGAANRTLFYQYDGTYWHWFHGGYDANDNTYTSAYCSTAAGTAAKAASCSGYVLLNNSYLHIIITNSNTSAGALTLNVDGKGAKPIYINGVASSSSNHTLPAGSYLVFYNGTNYYFRTDGKLTTSITGDAATVNGKTVGVNVPADAKFTDNNTTYTFANGTNGFTVTPSGGTAQTISVTPNITNNITGNGASGYIAKFNGAHTITSGPQLGSSTTTYLRNDGSWSDPEHVYVGASAPENENYDVWIDTSGVANNTSLINLIYPIGSFYTSANNINPGTLFSVGTWEQVECNEIIQKGTLSGTNLNRGYYRIYANGDFEAWGESNTLASLSANTAYYTTANLPFTPATWVITSGFGQCGDWAGCYVMSVPGNNYIGINVWNGSGSTKTNIVSNFISKGTVDLETNNITTLYKWKRTA